MCGILALFNGEKNRVHNVKLGEFLLGGCITGVLRGLDSTGMYQVKKNRDVRIFKQPVDGGTFAQMRGAQNLFKEADNTSATIIHHRAATHGVVSLDNCHPFSHEDTQEYIIGVHNGGVPSFSRKEDGLDFEVDSDWLYYQIFKHGPEKALQNLPASAAYALVWYDQTKDKHYIASNGQRSISFAFVKDKNIMLAASEHAHLYWLANRFGIEFEETIWHPHDNTIYEFDVSDLRKYKTVKVPEKPVVKYNSTNYSSGRYWNAQKGAWEDKTESAYGGILLSTTSTDTHTVQERFSDAACKSIGVELSGEYEFAPDAPNPEDKSFPRKVYGVISAGKEGEVIHAVMEVRTPHLMENLQAAMLVRARALGVRDETHKTSSIMKRFVLLSQPTDLILPVEESNVEQDNEFGPVEKFARGPRGKNLTEAQYMHMVKDGCGHCSADIDLRDQDFIGWGAGGTTPICSMCLDDAVSGGVDIPVRPTLTLVK